MQIKKQIEAVLSAYPQLVFNENKNTLVGVLEAFPNDNYNVSIDLNPWRKSFPWVYETGERIPVDLDRHVYLYTENCCFTTPRYEEIFLNSKVKTLLQFVKYMLIPYMQNNSYYEQNKKYINGEFSHTQSILQTYQTLLKIEDRLSIIKTLYAYNNGKKLTLKDSCYCGSKSTLRKCSHGHHKLGYETLKCISKKSINEDLDVLWKEHTKENGNT